MHIHDDEDHELVLGLLVEDFIDDDEVLLVVLIMLHDVHDTNE